MKSAKSKIILFFFSAAFVITVISACNSNPPVILTNKVAGTLPTFTSTPCWVLGSQTIASTPGTTYGGSVFWYPAVASANKTLTHLVMYSASSVPVTYEMAIYSDNASAPYYPLGQTGPVTSGPVTGWLQTPVSYTVSLSSGVTYWLALHSTNLFYQAAPASIYAYQNSIVTFGTLPSPFAGTLSGSYIFSLYGTACP